VLLSTFSLFLISHALSPSPPSFLVRFPLNTAHCPPKASNQAQTAGVIPHTNHPILNFRPFLVHNHPSSYDQLAFRPPSILYSVPSVHWLIGLVPSDVWYLKRSSQQPRFAWKPLQKPSQPPSIDSIIKAIIILFRE